MELAVEAEAADLGFDQARLGRIDAHFRRYVDDGRLAGWSLAVTRGGKVAHVSHCGAADPASGRPVDGSTLFRIYSMTKPVTAVAALMLYEEGAFELKDPVSRFIPAFAETRVYRAGSALNPVTEPAVEPMRIWHLLTHTAGLTYGFHHAHPVDAMYRAAGFEWAAPDLDLAACCDRWASLPLLFQPGSEWNYSVATDVLGRVVEVASRLPLDRFFAERIFEPLGMVDTAFSADEGAKARLATLCTPGAEGRARPIDDKAAKLWPMPFLSGGGGLLSSAADYHRFTQMLLNRGELGTARLLSSRTVDFMTTNQLPAGADLETFGRPLFAETTFEGVGFGLGVSVVLDPVANRVLSGAGEYGWGGAASTAFFVNPREELTASFFTQLLPSSTHPLRSQLKQLVYQALAD